MRGDKFLKYYLAPIKAYLDHPDVTDITINTRLNDISNIRVITLEPDDEIVSHQSNSTASER